MLAYIRSLLTRNKTSSSIKSIEDLIKSISETTVAKLTTKQIMAWIDFITKLPNDLPKTDARSIYSHLSPLFLQCYFPEMLPMKELLSVVDPDRRMQIKTSITPASRPVGILRSDKDIEEQIRLFTELTNPFVTHTPFADYHRLCLLYLHEINKEHHVCFSLPFSQIAEQFVEKIGEDNLYEHMQEDIRLSGILSHLYFKAYLVEPVGKDKESFLEKATKIAAFGVSKEEPISSLVFAEIQAQTRKQAAAKKYLEIARKHPFPDQQTFDLALAETYQPWF